MLSSVFVTLADASVHSVMQNYNLNKHFSIVHNSHGKTTDDAVEKIIKYDDVDNISDDDFYQAELLFRGTEYSGALAPFRENCEKAKRKKILFLLTDSIAFSKR